MSFVTTLGPSSSYRIFHQPFELSCNWFFVFQALCCPRNPNFSFFTPSPPLPGASERFSNSAMPTESRYCVPLDFQKKIIMDIYDSKFW
ncbi:hypothetical protein EAG_05323 [Camponotus floridanus]|uniref:Uncharacterized protein n=1 Tax=Camponotus floridanus TaxID=104421 RepID=E2A064_CAMFO|nr:hypothetical protein EAG_05323 [Camponotus floridanus]